MRKHTNDINSIQEHLDGLAEKHGDTEKICSRGGDCCLASVAIGDFVAVVPELPCKFLTFKSDGAACSVYTDRHHVAPWCRDLLSGMITGSYPVTCEYTKGLKGYSGGHHLSKAKYAQVRDHIRQQLAKGNRAQLGAAFHSEDITRFFKGTSTQKSIPEFEDTPEDWLSLNFPKIRKGTKDYIASLLYSSIGERTYFGSVDFVIVKSYLGNRLDKDVQYVRSIAKSLASIADITYTAGIDEQVHMLLAHRLVTTKSQGIIPRVLNRWLLENIKKTNFLRSLDACHFARKSLSPVEKVASEAFRVFLGNLNVHMNKATIESRVS